jgi:CHAD domain-containing protein
LKNLLRDFDKDEIHSFRLEIKKLRAFNLLVSHASLHERIKIHGSIKAFYNSAGDLRNLQLHHERIVELSKMLGIEEPQQHVQLLLEKELKIRESLEKLAGDLSLKKAKTALTENSPAEITGLTIQTFILQKKAGLEALILLTVYPDEALHEIRKHLKDLLYNWKYIAVVAPVFLPPLWTERDFIDKLADKIGEFHDLCISLSFLTTVHIDSIYLASEQSALQQLSAYFEQQKDQSKREIIDDLVPVRKLITNY